MNLSNRLDTIHKSVMFCQNVFQSIGKIELSIHKNVIDSNILTVPFSDNK